MIIKRNKSRAFNKKWLFILLGIAFLIIASFSIILTTHTKIDETARTETQETIWRFNGEVYEDFLDTYDRLIGFQPHLSMNKGSTILYPLNQQLLENLNETLRRTQERYADMNQINLRKSLTSNEQKTYRILLGEVDSTLQTIQSNLGILSDFYDAFILPVMSAAESNATNLRCATTAEMNVLLQSDDQNIANTAEQYYELYCMTVQSDIDLSAEDAVQKVQDLTYNKALAAAQALSECLLTADYAQSSENNIELLLEELAK